MDIKESLIQILFEPELLAAVTIFTILAGSCIGSLVEYLFPPFWGDTLIVVGFLAAGKGTVPLWSVFVAALVGGTIGAALAYALGHRLGGLPWLPRRVTRSERLERVQSWVRRRGALALTINRFLPGIRALFLPLAGALRIPPRRTLWAATAGNFLWLLFLAFGIRFVERVPGVDAVESATLALLLLLPLRFAATTDGGARRG